MVIVKKKNKRARMTSLYTMRFPKKMKETIKQIVDIKSTIANLLRS